ncbi:MAG: AraC family transcriptional regulator [Pseudomonadota bacterium]
MNYQIRAAGLQGYEALARSLGVDAEAELVRVGLSRVQLEDPDALLPHRSMIHLLEHTAQVSACADFGLRLSHLQGLGVLGPVSVAIRHARTLADALQVAARYLFVHSPAVRFDILPVDGHPESVDLAVALDLPDLPACMQNLELCLGVVAHCIRLLGEGRWRPTLAQFPHARQGPLRSYTEALGCPCRFEQGLTALRIPATCLKEPLAEHNSMLLQMAQDYLDQHFCSSSSFVADQVRVLVRRMLGTGRAGQAEIAAALAMHPRTLQRYLKKEGVRFDDIADAIRRERLMCLFGQVQAPQMGQVAAMLDYAEQAVLTRSCRRWFGVSPSELRRRVLAGCEAPGWS